LLFGKFIELIQTTFTGFLVVFTHVGKGYTGIGWKNHYYYSKVNGKSSIARHTEMRAVSEGVCKWRDETSTMFLNPSRVAGRGGRELKIKAGTLESETLCV
jgi:hypothetical protein